MIQRCSSWLKICHYTDDIIKPHPVLPRWTSPLVDDLASHLSRFLFFLVISQDSFAIPYMQDSCLKKQILTFWWYSCRQNLGWRGKKCLTRQDSCVLEFLSDSFFFLKFLSDSFFLFFLYDSFFTCTSCLLLLFLKFLPDFFFFSWIWYVY